MPPDATIIHSSMFAKYSIQRNSSFSVIWHLTLSVNARAVIIHSLIVIAQVDTLGAFSVVVKSLQTFVRSSVPSHRSLLSSAEDVKIVTIVKMVGWRGQEAVTSHGPDSCTKAAAANCKLKSVLQDSRLQAQDSGGRRRVCGNEMQSSLQSAIIPTFRYYFWK